MMGVDTNTGAAQTGAAQTGDVVPLGRIYHDPAVPELVCRYPNEPVVTVLSTSPREVVVSLAGSPVRVGVRNGDIAKVGRDYLMLREGDDKGLWLLIEPGET
ncbi:MAG: hypothetical protein HY332_24660 [Chloroflexi bacterium]|nr:hypothetical protein [Chloroflexota bacterium]